MIYGLTLAGAIHSMLAASSIGIGLIQLLRRKGGPAHRARGHAYVYAMLIADGAAMLVFQFTGQFNIFHIGAIVNLVCIILGIMPMLRKPRPSNWRYLHYYCMSWSYVGLLAAAATELVVRTSHLGTRGQAWMVTTVITAIVTVIGYILIDRHRPVAGSPPILHEGVLS
jgi:uncharacterized membrane protein